MNYKTMEESQYQIIRNDNNPNIDIDHINKKNKEEYEISQPKEKIRDKKESVFLPGEVKKEGCCKKCKKKLSNFCQENQQCICCCTSFFAVLLGGAIVFLLIYFKVPFVIPDGPYPDRPDFNPYS